MALITRQLTNIGSPLVTPAGVLLSGVVITFTLVDSIGNVTSPFDTATGERVAGHVFTVTDINGVFSIQLWPNDRGDKLTKYVCTCLGYGPDFSSQVPSGAAALSWLNFKTNGVILTPAQLLALDAHIGDATVHLSLTQNILLDAIANNITSNEINMLAGATSNIQSQINASAALIDLKAPLASPTFTGTVGGITGTMVGNTPAGGITSSTVQPALNELDAKKNTTADIFSDFVVSGLLSPTSATLASTISAGVAYVTGLRTVKAAEAFTYAASSDTYEDLASTGVITRIAVATGAAAPALTANNLRLQKVVTGATTVTTVTRLAVLTSNAPKVNALTVTAAAQPNITSVGTLSSLAVTGNTTAGSSTVSGRIAIPDNVLGDLQLGYYSLGSPYAIIRMGGNNTPVQIRNNANIAVVELDYTGKITTAGGVAVTGNLSATGTVTAPNLTTTADIFSDFVVSGLLSPTSATLSSTIAAGVAYVTGLRTVKAAEAFTYTASVDTYEDLASTGVITRIAVALGAAAPALTANNLRLQKVVTDATTVTTVTQLAATLPVTPSIIGGAAAGSNITYKATTGIGTTAGIAHRWTGGTNGGTVIATMLNNGNVGVGTLNPNDTLSVLDKFVIGTAAGSDGGFRFKTTPNFSSGSVTEAGGAILSYGINVSQLGVSAATVVGGIFRLDTRVGSFSGGAQSFIVLGTPVGGSETPRIIVSLQDGTTALAPYGGFVGIGKTTPTVALDVVGSIVSTTTIKTGSYTVATLPAGTVGERAYVTDALAPTWNGALTGGGTVVVPVFRNATVWVSA